MSQAILRRWPAVPGLGLLVAAVLLLTTEARATGAGDFHVLLRHTGLPQELHPAPGQALTSEKTQALWRGLLQSPATLGTFAPRTTLATAARVPVLGVSVQGALVVRELALPAGAVTVAVGAGAVGASVVLMAQGSPPDTASWTPPSEGPGQWVPENASMSPEARRYQAQVSGAPEGWAYSIRIGPGPKDKVDFDGFKNGVLLEAKGPGYRELLERMYGKPFFEGIDELLKQAIRQRKVSNGLPIHWHFAEREVADLARKLFKERGYTDIQVFYTPVQP
jgi:hypothetical protein